MGWTVGGRDVLSTESFLFFDVQVLWSEELLGDKGGNERRKDHNRHKLGVLSLIDESVAEAARK